jgi:hypothetical protein
MNFSNYVHRQKYWSLETFGRGKRTDGICKHIEKELEEILSADNDKEKLTECIDVIILAMDMAWRLGFTPEQIEYELDRKQRENFFRKWPTKEISEANQDKPTYHIKE